MKRVVLIGLLFTLWGGQASAAQPCSGKPCWDSLPPTSGKSRTWVSPEQWPKWVTVEPDMWIGEKRLNWQTHANGCAATYTGRGALAVTNFCRSSRLRIRYSAPRRVKLRYVAR